MKKTLLYLYDKTLQKILNTEDELKTESHEHIKNLLNTRIYLLKLKLNRLDKKIQLYN